MSNPSRTQIEVYSKAGDLIASFSNPIATPDNPSAALTSDERREVMIDPTVKLVQNGESSFTFKMLVSAEKFHLIKTIGNRFHVNGRVYTALTDDAIVYGYEGEDSRVATVTLVEEQYTLQKKFVQAYNVMPYSKALATAGVACVAYDRTEKVAEIATFVISSADANFQKALLWDITDTIYILEPSDTWEEPPTYINPVSITKTEESITITFYNLGGAIPLGATALFGAGIESIDDHTVTILPKANKKYKLTIDGVQYEDSVVLDERGILMPRGSGGYALWAMIRHTGWQLGTCDIIHDQFNTTQVDAVAQSEVRDFTGIYGTYKDSSKSWVFDVAQSTDSAFRRALNWKVGDTLYIADISDVDDVPEWTDAPDSVHITYFSATDSRITIKTDGSGTIVNDCVVAFSNAGAALEAKFVVPSSDAGFSLANTWEDGYSLSVYDAVGWADAPVSARILSVITNEAGDLEITILNLGGLISAGATVRFISGSEVGVFNCETDAKDIFENIKLVQELWGGVLVFDSFHKVIHYRDEEKEGTDFNTWNGYTIKRGKNLTASPSVSWNADIITRLYPLGSDKLNIALVNDGKRYVDDFSFTDEVLEGYVEQPNIYDTLDDGGMLQLLYWAQREVAKVCKPRMTVKYENKVVDRRQIGGYEFDVFDLNSIVKAYYIDSESGEETSELLRIVNWEYNVWNPLTNTTIEVGDIKANVRDIFKLIYKKTEEMPAFDAKGRISADDISVGSSSSSSSRRGGGGSGGGGGTLADELEKQIQSNAYFYQKFDQQSAVIGAVAQFATQTDEYSRSGIAALDIKVDETSSALQASVRQTYETLSGEITQTDATLRLWAEDSFASAELTTRYNNLVSGMGNYTSIKQFADATYAKTEIEAWVNSTRSYLTVSGGAITMSSGGQFVGVGLGAIYLSGSYVDLDGDTVAVGSIGSVIKMWGSEVEFHSMDVLESVSVNTVGTWVATLPSGSSSVDVVRSSSLEYSASSGTNARSGYIITNWSTVNPISSITLTKQVVSGVSVVTGISVDRLNAASISTSFVRFPTGILNQTSTLGRTQVSEVQSVSRTTASKTFVTRK